MPGHKAPRAVFVQAVFPGAEGQQLPGDGPGQRGAGHRGGPAGVQAPGFVGQLRGPVGGGGSKVQPDAHHQPFQPPALKVGARFGQNAADLFALIIKVVHPLDGKLQPAQVLHRPANRHGGADGGGLGAGGGQFRPQQDGAVDPLARRAFEFAAQPPPARALVGREHQCAVGGTVQRQQLCRAVGAFQRVVDVHRGGVGAHGFGAEGVAARQPVAPAGNGFQRVALGREGGGGFVHRRAAHAQRVGQLLAGNIIAPCGRKGLQQGLTGACGHGVGPPFVL